MKTSERSSHLLRQLPKIDLLLRLPAVGALADEHGRERVTAVLREMVEELRAEIGAGKAPEDRIGRWTGEVGEALRRRLESDLESLLIPVINATGVLIHTNLGRSPLSAEAVRRIHSVTAGYSTLEYDLARGERGSRSVHAQRLLGRLFPGASSAVVNNNAAAVLLALNTLAEGKEVIVSRGELVEIGGSFRIPDVMRKSQAVLREVGTTNRTRIADYEEAVGAATGLLLKVHTSNYRIVGFTARPTLAELAELGRRRGLPVMVDQGSGCLSDLASFGIEDEPSVARLLADGADLVTFSGDKLLGGPQAGILVGRRDLLERIARNPLSRALRPDKITLAALEATLASHLRGRASRDLPLLRMLEESEDSVGRRAQRCADAIEQRSGGAIRAEVVPGASVMGGGAAPGTKIPTRLLALSAESRSSDALEQGLRRGRPAVIGRIESDRLVLDLRTVPEDREAELVEAVAALGSETER
ncbi:MAG TPA: L-seryl-tRNA(Sec) selenium transferase [Candidatus Polarisedimenticolia bacterium]|nr:L-seryl-tRNA(Sec) selenium transferase [Candidatus Polarisedimenticolia bacterium]